VSAYYVVSLHLADQSCQAHVPIIGIDIWEHVRCYSQFLVLLLSDFVFSGLLSSGALLSVLNVSHYSPLFTCQYKNVKADVCPPHSRPLIGANLLVHAVPRRDLERRQL
jgi:hypothetical protein